MFLVVTVSVVKTMLCQKCYEVSAELQQDELLICSLCKDFDDVAVHGQNAHDLLAALKTLHEDKPQ